jgi:hypothetical protein
VIRYDGQHFTIYTKAQGLAGNVVFCILHDKNNNTWIGTTGGLSKYDGKSFKISLSPATNPPPCINNIKGKAFGEAGVYKSSFNSCCSFSSQELRHRLNSFEPSVGQRRLNRLVTLGEMTGASYKGIVTKYIQ